MKPQHVALFVGMLAVTANAAGQDDALQRSAAEKKAIAAIRKLGGHCRIDNTNPGHPFMAVSFYKNKSTVTDAGIVHLENLKQLRELYLGRTKISDVGLAHLMALTKLRHLTLHHTMVTRAGKKRFKAAVPRCIFGP